MKNLVILGLAGLLSACATDYSADPPSGPPDTCQAVKCLIKISVVDGKIVPDRPTLTVTRDEVVLLFQIVTNGFSFVDDSAQAIAFDPADNPSQHFSKTFRRNATNMVVFDSNDHGGGKYKYEICLKEVAGCLDPVIVNH